MLGLPLTSPRRRSRAPRPAGRAVYFPARHAAAPARNPVSAAAPAARPRPQGSGRRTARPGRFWLCASPFAPRSFLAMAGPIWNAIARPAAARDPCSCCWTTAGRRRPTGIADRGRARRLAAAGQAGRLAALVPMSQGESISRRAIRRIMPKIALRWSRRLSRQTAAATFGLFSDFLRASKSEIPVDRRWPGARGAGRLPRASSPARKDQNVSVLTDKRERLGAYRRRQISPAPCRRACCGPMFGARKRASCAHLGRQRPDHPARRRSISGRSASPPPNSTCRSNCATMSRASPSPTSARLAPSRCWTNAGGGVASRSPRAPAPISRSRCSRPAIISRAR